MLSIMKHRLKYYGKKSNIHGLKYIADDARHPLIRIFWIFVVVLNVYGMLLYIYASYRAFNENAISFVTETAYLNWNTTFPAISICEITASEISYKNDLEDSAAVHEFINELIFFTGSCYSCNNDCESCPSLNFTSIVQMFRKKCNELLVKCKWNNKIFDCCEKFLPLETEYGICYSLNSLHTHKTKTSEIDLNSNRKTGPGQLLIQTAEDVRMYFHATEDVPYINSDADQRKDIMLKEVYNMSFHVIEIENDENVKYLPVHKRGCRFPWELPDNIKVHRSYSYSTCIVQCHAAAHIRLCNCTHHLMPVLNKEKYCDIEGLQCLTDNFETVNRLHAEGYDKMGLVCNDCLPSCVEPEFRIVSELKGTSGTSLSEISIKMQSLPTSRFKRIVIRTTMDLVVSIGGNAGLFIGASLLSVVEVFYLLLLRRQ